MEEFHIMPKFQATSPTLDIVIPAYNARDWLPACIEKAKKSASFAGINLSKIIVIDDGSTDGTAEVLNRTYADQVLVHSQKNQGRFVARETGASLATSEFILFLDSRVWIDEAALSFVLPYLRDENSQVWTCDVTVSLTDNPIARFWFVIERIFWNYYYKEPRSIKITTINFDLVPKGTGALLIPRNLFLTACKEFRSFHSLSNLKKINDDTAILRQIVSETPIMIDPSYKCTYFARTSIKSFLRHANHRGSVLIDGHWRQGTRLRTPITASFFLVPALILFAAAFTRFSITAALIVQFAVFLELLRRRFGLFTSSIFVLLAPAFSLAYFSGMIYGLLLRARNHV